MSYEDGDELWFVKNVQEGGWTGSLAGHQTTTMAGNSSNCLYVFTVEEDAAASAKRVHEQNRQWKAKEEPTTFGEICKKLQGGDWHTVSLDGTTMTIGDFIAMRAG